MKLKILCLILPFCLSIALCIQIDASGQENDGWHFVHESNNRTLYFVVSNFLFDEYKSQVDEIKYGYHTYFQFVLVEGDNKKIIYEEGWWKLISNYDYFIKDMTGDGINEVIILYEGHHFHYGVEIYHYDPPIGRRLSEGMITKYYSDWKENPVYYNIPTHEIPPHFQFITIGEKTGIRFISRVSEINVETLLYFYDNIRGYIEVLDTDQFEGKFEYYSEEIEIELEISLLKNMVYYIRINYLENNNLSMKLFPPDGFHQRIRIFLLESGPYDWTSHHYYLELLAIINSGNKVKLPGIITIEEYSGQRGEQKRRTLLTSPILLKQKK